MIERAGRSRAQLIVSRVYEGWRGQGAAADLLCLLDDPDAAVAEAVADTLGWYRDKTAREMLLRLCDHPADSVRELSARSLDYLSDAET
jgi:HEAT repeat protein